jgi:hypothetical protein
MFVSNDTEEESQNACSCSVHTLIAIHEESEFGAAIAAIHNTLDDDDHKNVTRLQN